LSPTKEKPETYFVQDMEECEDYPTRPLGISAVKGQIKESVNTQERNYC
jgi:hypothetical protein